MWQSSISTPETRVHALPDPVRQDQRSPEANSYRKLYKTARWQRAREAQLKLSPLCNRCLEQGIITWATVVNHRTPHKGNLDLFWNSENYESSCKQHHDGAIQSEERIGFSKAVDESGWPRDPRHPSNGGRT